MTGAVLLSGGVDSSVALYLLREQGHDDIQAFYLKIWLEDELAFLGNCPWETDLAFARAVCAAMGVPLTVVPLQAEYQQRIVQHAIAELKAGRTPSPDILCNQEIKFGAFYDHVDNTFAWVATGHYAQREERGGQYYLKRSPDPVKDQTYFLYRLDQRQLARAKFPIGHLQKSEVRRLAAQWRLPNMDRKDSQGLCFLGKIKYDQFVKFHLGEQEGNIVDVATGAVLGIHAGYWFYTIGQRQGLELGGGPWYVVSKDITTNVVYVAHREKLHEAARNEFTIRDVHWIVAAPITRALLVRIRHGGALQPCEIERLNDNRIRVVMSTADSGVASGQSAIFYDGEYCLGGGIIE